MLPFTRSNLAFIRLLVDVTIRLIISLLIKQVQADNGVVATLATFGFTKGRKGIMFSADIL